MTSTLKFNLDEVTRVGKFIKTEDRTEITESDEEEQRRVIV